MYITVIYIYIYKHIYLLGCSVRVISSVDPNPATAQALKDQLDQFEADTQLLSGKQLGEDPFEERQFGVLKPWQFRLWGEQQWLVGWLVCSS